MIKVKLWPHPNQIKVFQVYLFLGLIVLALLFLFLLPFILVLGAIVIGAGLVFYLVNRFAGRFSKKSYSVTLDDENNITDAYEKNQPEFKSNIVERRYGVGRIKIKSQKISGLHIDDWKRYFDR